MMLARTGSVAVMPEHKIGRLTLYDYCALGFRIRSDFPIPELSVQDDGYAADTLEIIREAIDPAAKQVFSNDDWIAFVDGAAIVRIDSSGWMAIRNGRQIFIEANSPADLEMVSLFIAATALPIAALQRGNIPLHIAAVRISGGVHLFAGESGAGKSTIVAALRSLGHTILTDDIAVYCRSPSTASAPASHGRLHFGVNRIKLWRDAAELIRSAGTAVKQDYFRTQKLHFAIAGEASVAVEEIASVVRLAWVSEPDVKTLPQSKKFELLMNAVYPRRIVLQMIDLGTLRSEILKIASFGQGVEVARPRSSDVYQVLDRMLSAPGFPACGDHPAIGTKK